MPTVISESDAFVATIQRPNNGELADAASISLYAQHLANSRRYLYNRARGRMFDVTRAPYNADPTGATDSRAAINSAILDAWASSGDVFLPGFFRCDGKLDCVPSVNLRGLPYLSRLRINHATQDQLSFAGPTVGGSPSGNACEVSDICFDASVANTGRAVYNDAAQPVDVIFRNCSWNDGGGSGNLNGDLFGLNGASKFSLIDCNLFVRGSSVYAARQTHASGRLIMRGGSVSMPAAFSTGLIRDEAGYADIQGVKFDLSTHTTGAPSCIQLTAGGRIVGNLFQDLGVGPTKRAVSALSGSALVNASGNTYVNVTRFGGGFFALGSSLDLLEFWNISTSSAAITIPDCMASVVVRETGGSATRTITLPQVLYPGQELDLVVFNDTASGFFHTIISGIDAALGDVLMNIGQAAAWRFRAMGTVGFSAYHWVPVSGPTALFAP